MPFGLLDQFDPSVKRFKQIKKGDEVVVRHTEALAISVQKP